MLLHLQVLIVPHTFLSQVTSQTWCNIPQKFMPVKVKQTEKLRGITWLTLSISYLPGSIGILLLTFSSLYTYPLLIHNEMNQRNNSNSNQSKPKEHNYFNLPSQTNLCLYLWYCIGPTVSLSVHMFLFCFYPWPYILNVSLVTNKIFSVPPSTYSIIYSEKYALFWGKF